jgi:hypothetical protein
MRGNAFARYTEEKDRQLGVFAILRRARERELADAHR